MTSFKKFYGCKKTKCKMFGDHGNVSETVLEIKILIPRYPLIYDAFFPMPSVSFLREFVTEEFCFENKISLLFSTASVKLDTALTASHKFL